MPDKNFSLLIKVYFRMIDKIGNFNATPVVKTTDTFHINIYYLACHGLYKPQCFLQFNFYLEFWSRLWGINVVPPVSHSGKKVGSVV